MGPVSRKTALLRASLRKNPGKGENTKKQEGCLRPSD